LGGEQKMSNRIEKEQLKETMKESYPFWPEELLQQQAKEYMEVLDERLEDILKEYIKNGRQRDFEYGEFSVLFIQALRHNCPYLEAVKLMSEYLKNPKSGKAHILRR